MARAIAWRNPHAAGNSPSRTRTTSPPPRLSIQTLAKLLAAKSRQRAVRDEMVAEGEGEELETNLLQASERNPASSCVLDEVFGTQPHQATQYSQVNTTYI